jgi:hypothetical protein
MINSEFALSRATSLAARLCREAGDEVGRITRAYRLALGRGPKPHEIDQAREFLDKQAERLRREDAEGPHRARSGATPAGIEPAVFGAWVDFALAMLNRNEFVYVP